MLTPICSSPSSFRACRERPTQRSQGHAAAGDNAFFDGRTGGMHGVFDAGLLFLHFGFGRGADFDHGHATDQLRQPLLQLLAVVVAGGLLDLAANFLHAAFDVRRACLCLR